jgi:hypothetical protein
VINNSAVHWSIELDFIALDRASATIRFAAQVHDRDNESLVSRRIDPVHNTIWKPAQSTATVDGVKPLSGKR